MVSKSALQKKVQNSTGPTHKQQVQKFGEVVKTGGVIGEHISRHWILEGLKELNFITNIDIYRDHYNSS